MLELSPDLLAILADPETHQPVSLATEDELGALREAIKSGRAKRKDGGAIPEHFDGAFLSQGGKVAYLVVDGIPNFLIEERLEIAGA
jgi:uncharacterized protein YbaR (Trm112 family)